VHLAKLHELIHLGGVVCTGKTKLDANLHCRDEIEGQMPRLKVGNAFAVRVGANMLSDDGGGMRRGGASRTFQDAVVINA
jgi:hypothetical protein